MHNLLHEPGHHRGSWFIFSCLNVFKVCITQSLQFSSHLSQIAFAVWDQQCFLVAMPGPHDMAQVSFSTPAGPGTACTLHTHSKVDSSLFFRRTEFFRGLPSPCTFRSACPLSSSRTVNPQLYSWSYSQRITPSTQPAAVSPRSLGCSLVLLFLPSLCSYSVNLCTPPNTVHYSLSVYLSFRLVCELFQSRDHVLLCPLLAVLSV